MCVCVECVCVCGCGCGGGVKGSAIKSISHLLVSYNDHHSANMRVNDPPLYKSIYTHTHTSSPSLSVWRHMYLVTVLCTSKSVLVLVTVLCAVCSVCCCPYMEFTLVHVYFLNCTWFQTVSVYK